VIARGSLAALLKGEYEAGENSLGLDYAQAMRLIILPHGIENLDPGYRETSRWVCSRTPHCLFGDLDV